MQHTIKTYRGRAFNAHPLDFIYVALVIFNSALQTGNQTDPFAQDFEKEVISSALSVGTEQYKC